MTIGQGEVLDHSTLLSVESGSLIEGVTGIGAVVLSILGLAGISPHLMLSVAVIAVAAGLLIQGMAVSARFSAIMDAEVQHRSVELKGGVSAETLGGVAGVALGILALVGLAPLTLAAVADIVFGVAIILASRVNFRLNTMEAPFATERSKAMAHQAVAASADHFTFR